ncbi:MAG: hypothetical protein KHX55_01665 [Proteobacteria bacterium]|nr:hypothetical protein [Pseudomonadota bacterium]
MYFETEEEKQKRLAQQQENLSFRDELKQNLQKAGLLGEEKVMTGPLGNITYYDEPRQNNAAQEQNPLRLQNPLRQQTPFRPQPQDKPMSWGEKAAGLGKVAASGVTLNTIDELAGVAGDVINAGWGLLPNSSNHNRSFSDNFRTGYQVARDDWRNDVAAAKREMPVLANAVEGVASAVSPLGVTKAAAAAPLALKSVKGLQSAVNSGIINGWGSTEENTAAEYAKNIGRSTLSNTIGHRWTNNAMGRAGDPLTRTVISNTISSGINGGLQSIFPIKTLTAEEDEEEKRRRMLGYY